MAATFGVGIVFFGCLLQPLALFRKLVRKIPPFR